ncbi:MAG: L-threonylcarbamoyladenylate synthase [Phycisphaerales bacterium JB059]
MHADPETIRACVERLRAGGLVAFPTETVYGLGAIATDEDAVRRVFALKGRPSRNPLIVHVDGEETARRYVRHWPEEAHRLAAAFWPGPLTLVLPRSGVTPDVVTGGGETVGVRCPDHPLTLALLEALGEGLVGPSANASGGVSPTTAEHVRDAFGEDEVLTLDGGACRAGIESTVLDLTTRPARVLRPGVIGRAQLAGVLGEAVEAHEGEAEGDVRSPGLLGPHYAPRARTRLFTNDGELEALRVGLGAGRVVVIAHGKIAAPGGAQVLRLPSSAAGYAARLYASLREADAMGPDLIAVERPPNGAEDEGERAIWEAVLERLTRAADSG